MVKQQLSKRWLQALAGLFTILIAIALAKLTPVTAETTTVSGRVTYPDGSPAPTIWMSLHTGDGSQSFSMQTGGDGTYSFNVSLTDGYVYTVEYTVPAGYNRGSDTPYMFTYHTGDAARTNANFQLVAAAKTVTGRVTYSDGRAVTDADIEAYPVLGGGTGKVATRTGSDGAYTMTMTGGLWFVNAVANLSEWNVQWITESTPVEVTFANDSTTETSTQNFTVMPATGKLTVILLNSDGSKLTTNNFVADIDVRRADGIGTVRKVKSEDSSLPIYLTPGIYRMCAFHQDLEGKSFDPEKTTLVMTENGNVDLGTVRAEVDSAHLKGTVKDLKGKALENIQLQAFSENGCSRPVATTDANGAFDITVGAGTWTVGLRESNNPMYSQAAPAVATVKNSETASGLTVTMKTVDRTVSGSVVNSAGTVLTDFVGTAYIRSAKQSGGRIAAPVVNGAFTITYASSDIAERNVLLGVVADPGSGYATNTEVRVTVSTLGQGTKNVTVKPYDATIQGTLRTTDGTAVVEDGSTITVYAVDEDGNFTSTTASATDGTYSLAVAGGTWYVNYDIADPTSTESFLDRPAGQDKVTVTSGGTTTKDLTVLKGTTTVRGTVTDADGTPVPAAKVTVDNRAELENRASINQNAIVTTTVETDTEGKYSVGVPSGTYLVTVGDTPAVDDDELQPDGKTVKVSGASTVTADFRYEATDATLTGTVKLQNKAEGGGTVTAYSKDGAQATAPVAADGTYTLNVTSGEQWTVVATDLAQTTLAASEMVEVTPKEGANTNNLTLTDTGEKVYGPVTKSFDATKPGSVALPDGTTVSVPAYALDMTGEVSLTVAPVVEPDPTTGDVAAGLAYEVKATDADGNELRSLNKPATIVIPYPQAAADQRGLREKSLSTKYFNTETAQWEESAGFVDAQQNVAKTITTHLTKFSVTGTQKAVPKVTKFAVTSVTAKAVTIQFTGTNFSGNVKVSLGGVKATTVRVKSATLLEATFSVTKFKAGKQTLVMTNGNGRTYTKENALTLKKVGNTLRAASAKIAPVPLRYAR